MGGVIKPLRGRVYMVTTDRGRKPWLVVSNNARNRALQTCSAVRLTTSPKPDLATIIELSSNDPLAGRVLCDDLAIFHQQLLEEDRGALSPQTMVKVADGLRVALAL